MKHQIVTKIAGCRMSKILSVILSVMVAALGFPMAATTTAPGGGVPSAFYVQNANGLFLIDISEFMRNHQAIMNGSGEMSIAVYKAVFPDTEAQDSEAEIFRFGEEPSEEDLVILGSDPAIASTASGYSLDVIQEWKEVIAVSVSGSVDEIQTTFRIGEDTLSTIYPREMFDRGMDDPPEEVIPSVVVIVNGVIAEMDAADIMNVALAMAGDGLIPDIGNAEELLDLLNSFQNETRFVNGYLGLGVILTDLISKLSENNAPNTCVFKCLSCAAILITYGVTIGALIASCGPTLGLGCVLAIMAHGAAAAFVIANCGSCFKCISESSHNEYPIPDWWGGLPESAF